MFIAEVEIVKQWTDRGSNPWVRVRVVGQRDETEIDVEPSKIKQVKRSLILVDDDGS